MPDEQRLTTGALADAAGVGRETIRFYERRGLLEEPPRTAAGYRLYPPDTVQRLDFIRRAQELGFTLSEVTELLELRADEASVCEAVEVRARQKLEQVHTKLADLRRIEGALSRLVDTCQAREPTGECPILEELEEGS